MKPEEFRAYLRELQKEKDYRWPNDYFSWEKPDGSLLMIGIRSTQRHHILKHELEEDKRAEKQKFLDEIAPGSKLLYERKYVTGFYSISPSVVHLEEGKDGKGLVEYDPVEKLINEISECRYLGSWHDPDILMDSPFGYSRQLACGRFDLAKEHISQTVRKPSLNDKIQNAQEKAVQNVIQEMEKAPSQNHSKQPSGYSGRT